MSLYLYHLMTITPSLKGFFIGIGAGAVVLSLIFGGLLVISLQDKIQRS
jgi:photosystem II PsbX protein